MAHPAYLRAKAIELRLKRRMSIVEIAERLALPKTTIYYWVRDIPLQRPRRANPGQRRGNLAMKRKYRKLRDDAYEEGWTLFAELARVPTFRDFVCMYIGEGYKRDRNAVSICNSDPRVVLLAANWIRHLSRNKVRFSLQYHADQDPSGLCSFWAVQLGVDPAAISLQRKSNSGQLSQRTWRSRYGVLAVRVGDTMLRARLQAWMDCIKDEWLDSPAIGA